MKLHLGSVLRIMSAASWLFRSRALLTVSLSSKEHCHIFEDDEVVGRRVRVPHDSSRRWFASVGNVTKFSESVSFNSKGDERR